MRTASRASLDGDVCLLAGCTSPLDLGGALLDRDGCRGELLLEILDLARELGLAVALERLELGLEARDPGLRLGIVDVGLGLGLERGELSGAAVKRGRRSDADTARTASAR